MFNADAEVFISYASRDRDRVVAIARCLEAQGIRVWRDQKNILGGEIYGPAIVRGIRESKVLMLMCSDASLWSRNVRQEILLAWKYERPYLPLLLEPVRFPEQVEYWLEGWQWIEVLEEPSERWLPAVLASLAAAGVECQTGLGGDATGGAGAGLVPVQPIPLASTLDDLWRLARYTDQIWPIPAARSRGNLRSLRDLGALQADAQHRFRLGERVRLVIESDRAGYLLLLDQGTSGHLVMRRKAIGAEALAAQRDAVLGGRYPHLQPQLQALTGLRRQIAQQTLAGPGDRNLKTYRRQLAEWTVQRERLEAELARQIPEMNLSQRLATADRQAVANALPRDTALVEFVRFTVFDFLAVPAQGEPSWKTARYLAFVLPAGEPDQVQMLDLEEAMFIDRRIAQFRAAITGEPERRRDLGDQPLLTISDGNHAGRELRRLLFDPLLPSLNGRQQILLSPDGDLARLPFEVLPTDDGQRLIDTYHLSYVATGHDVLRFGVRSTGQAAAPLIAADPDFDLGGGPGQFQPAAGRHSRDLDHAHLHFTPLPGTRLEGERIAGMLQVQPWLQDAALEAKVKAQRSPRILHLATHGFFLKDQPYNLEKSQWMSFTGSELGHLAGPGLENPLLRSGLALAGANTWLKGQNPPPDAEDGLLTAEDVTGLDLIDTELVVLSACETGLGDVQIGEGVLGLRRAFVLAGAKTLVMSLWKVPDQQTQELMEDFYTRLLQGHQPRADALRETQLTMKARHPEPLYWGAFICQGELGPLHQP